MTRPLASSYLDGLSQEARQKPSQLRDHRRSRVWHCSPLEVIAQYRPLLQSMRLAAMGARAWLLASSALWQALRRQSSHPLARHLRKKSRQSKGVLEPARLLPGSLLWGCLLLAMLGQAYSAIGAGIIWALPLWLMGFSAWACIGWIWRIADIRRRQNHGGAMAELSVIPPGQVFVWLLICKLALNEGDALVWLGLLRRILAGLLLLCLVMALLIAATQIGAVAPLELGGLLASLLMIGAVILLEHRQSAVLACLTAIIVCSRPQSQIDKSSAAVAGFTICQALSYALALALATGLGLMELSIVFVFFLLIREGLIAALWKLLLRHLNEDDPLQGGEPWTRALGRGI